MVLNDARQFSTSQAGLADGSGHAGLVSNTESMLAAAALGKLTMHAAQPTAAAAPASHAVILKPADASLVAGCEGRASHLLAPVSDMCPVALERLLLS